MQKATSLLSDCGLNPEPISEMGSVKVFRLLEGTYTRDQADKRLEEIKNACNSAFIIPEKGKFSIYVATYHDRGKAIQKTEELAKKDIRVTLVSTEVEVKCTKLVVKQVEQSNISLAEDQLSKMDLPVKIVKSG